MRKKTPEVKGGMVEYGSVRALMEIIRDIRLIETIDNIAPKRNGISVGKLVALMAINRCLDPMAKREIPDWYRRTYLPELLGIDLPMRSGYQTLTRCMDYLTDSVQMEIEAGLAGSVIEQCPKESRIHLYDITSTFVEGKGEAEILQYGYSRDNRPDCKQVNFGLMVTRPNNIPLFHQAFPGNLVDSATLKETMAMFQERLGLDGCIVVDRGIVTHDNIEEIVDVRGLDLIGGLRMDKKLKRKVREIPLTLFGPTFQIGKEAIRSFEFRLTIRSKERRCILYYSGEKAARDRQTRERHIRNVANELESLSASLMRKGRGRKRTLDGICGKIEKVLEENECQSIVKWRTVGGRGGRRLKWRIDKERLAEVELLDGKYILITTLDLPPKETLSIYRSRNGVEQAFRLIKESIRIRPIWNRKESHIKAHLFICFIAYLLMAILQLRIRKFEPGLTAIKAIKRLGAIQKRVDRVIVLTREIRFLKKFIGE